MTKKSILLIALGAVVLGGVVWPWWATGYADKPAPTRPPDISTPSLSTLKAFDVVRVADGDTIFIEKDGKPVSVRLIGVDTLGLDENNCPTIIEYNRNSNANVINQGLFYLDWLMDHQGEFELLVQRTFGQEAAKQIDWSAPRLLCIAEDFTRYDTHAIQQINRNIELLRYSLFGDDLLMLDLVNAISAKPMNGTGGGPPGPQVPAQYTTQEEHLAKASKELKELFGAVRDHMLDMGDDVQERFLKWYVAYKRLRNFATTQFRTQKDGLLMWLPIDPDAVTLEDGFSRSVRDIGHHGTGDLELTIRSLDDLEKAKPLIQKSFEEN